MVVVIFLVMRFGFVFIYCVVILFYIIVIVVLVFMYVMSGEFNLLWLVVGVIIVGFGRGVFNYIFWNMYNYMVDVD